MRHLFLFATKHNGFGAAAASRATAEHGTAFMAWLAVVAGVAICAIAFLLL